MVCHAQGQPWDQTAEGSTGKGQMAAEGLPAPTPTGPSLFSLPVRSPSSFPSFSVVRKGQSVPYPVGAQELGLA